MYYLLYNSLWVIIMGNSFLKWLNLTSDGKCKLKDGTIISESKDSSKDKGKNSDDNGGISVSIGN